MQAAEVNYHAGLIRLARGEIDQAIAELEASVAASPGTSKNRQALARAYETAGKPEKAAAEYERARQIIKGG